MSINMTNEVISVVGLFIIFYLKKAKYFVITFPSLNYDVKSRNVKVFNLGILTLIFVTITFDEVEF